MYSVVRRQRHSSGSSNDGLFIIQASTYHEGRRDSAASDLFINSGVMSREGPALLPTSPSYSPPPPPPNTLASEAPEFRVQLRDTITSFLENAELTSEIPELDYSEEKDEAPSDLRTPKKLIMAAMVSSALKSFTLTSPMTVCRGMESLDISPREPGPSTVSKVTTRPERTASDPDTNLGRVMTIPPITTSPSSPLSTISEGSSVQQFPNSDTFGTAQSILPSPIPNFYPAPSTSHTSPEVNLLKRRRLDSSSESISPRNSNLNPDAAAFTPGSVNARARSNMLGARPKTGRSLFKRPKKKGANLS